MPRKWKALLLQPEEIIPIDPVKGRLFSSGKHTEAEFKNLIEQSQPLFKDFETFQKREGPLWLGPKGITAELPLEEFVKDGKKWVDLRFVWLDPLRRITFVRSETGKHLLWDGRHRLFVAKKYGFCVPAWFET